MPDESPNPCRLVIFTNDPGEAVNYEQQGWKMSDMLVLRFYLGLDPDLLNPKRYCLKFWRPEPERQPELF
jgi:hypothetical protein